MTVNPEAIHSPFAASEAARPHEAAPAARPFDIGINGRLPLPQVLLLGLQNVFGMTGMFVFPALLGHAFSLPAGQIAYLYGMTFIACGVCTILQSWLLLRLPIVQGPYAGSFGALLAIGHVPGVGLGGAYGSFFAATLVWLLLAVPIKGRSVVSVLARYLASPLLGGTMVMLIIIQIASVSLPNWIGQAGSPGFGLPNLLSGAVAVLAIIALMRWSTGVLRRAAILIGLALGSLSYMLFQPISFAAVTAAPLVVEPHLFPFGFMVRADLAAVFLVVLLAGSVGSMALYRTVADWGDEPLPPARAAEGVLGAGVGAVLAAAFGGFSTIAYPDNIGMLRATRVGSRYATLGAGVLLIVLGACVKFDMLLVVIPSAVISAAATLLFGIVFMHGVGMLARVEWDDRCLIAAGLGLLVGLGGLFIAPDTLKVMPLIARLVLQQPVISGGLTVVVLYALLRGRAPA